MKYETIHKKLDFCYLSSKIQQSNNEETSRYTFSDQITSPKEHFQLSKYLSIQSFFDFQLKT